MKRFHQLLILLAVMTLAACQTLPKLNQDEKPGGVALTENAQGQFIAPVFAPKLGGRDDVNAWKLSGSFSYVDPKDSGAGRIQWSLQGLLKENRIENERVRLIGPIGAGSVELLSSGSSAVLIAGKKRYLGQNVEGLLQDIVGWRMPINELRYWLFGVPSPQVPGKYWLDEQGSLIFLQQSGWQIEFSEYQVFDASGPLIPQMMPRKITAVNQANQAKVKLVIKQLNLQ